MIARKLFRWNVLVPAALVVACAGLLVSPLIAQDAQNPQPQTEEQQARERLRQQVEGLVEQLKLNDPALSESATDALKALGPDALPFVKEALAKSENPVVNMALEEVAEVLAAEHEKREAERRERERQNQRPAFPMGGSITLMDGTGQYSKRTTPDGRIVVTAKPNDGEEQTREFASEEEFQEQWPEVAGKFSMFRFRVQPMPRTPDEPDDQTQPFEGPFPGGPDMDDMQRRLEELMRRSEELRRMMEELQNGQPDPEEMLRRLQEMFETPQETPEQRAERERRRQERQRRLEELERNQPDPLQDPEGYARWLQEFMREQMAPLMPGNGNDDGQPLPFPFPRPGQNQNPNGNPNGNNGGEQTPDQPTDPDRQQPNQEDDDEEFIAFDGTPGSSPLAHVAAIGWLVFGPIPAPIRAQLLLADSEGMMVTGLRENGPLADAGVQRYDVVLEVNGLPVGTSRDVQMALDAVPAGADFTVKLIHRSHRLQLLGTK